MPTLGEIAAFLGAELKGEAAREIRAASPLDTAGPAELSFFANPRYAGQFAVTKAGAVLCSAPEAAKAPVGTPLLVSTNPYRDFARCLAKWFNTRPRNEAGVHASAVVHPSAKVHPTAHVGAMAYVGQDCTVGADCVIHPLAVLYDGCRLGARVIVHSGAVLGADGFGFAPDPPHGYVKVPQLGWVEVEDDVEIQANACVDRGALGATLIRRGAKIDNFVQIAHNVEVGEHTVLASQAGISGSTKIGKWVTFAGQSAAAGHLNIGDQAVITGQAGAGKDVPAKAMVSGSPAQPTLEHHRGLAEMGRLPELKRRVKELEARLADLEKKLA